MKAFRLLGYLEGISFLALLLIAMPLKYFAGIPEAVRVTGMTHGLLFMAYVLVASFLAFESDWPKKRFVLALVAAVLPLGTFAYDRRYLSEARTGR
jgi:integral membrane protein